MHAKLNAATEESDLPHGTMAGRSREAIMVIRSKSQPYIVVSSKGSPHARPTTVLIIIRGAGGALAYAGLKSVLDTNACNGGDCP
jgi:hypothetical protein